MAFICKLGLFELQDAGSQHISEFLGVEPGMRVIDACAGGGGKNTSMGWLSYQLERETQNYFERIFCLDCLLDWSDRD